MKFLGTQKDQLTFELVRREHELLLQVLRMYPLVPPSHHQLSKETSAQLEDQRLLEEALAEQRTQRRIQLRRMIDDASRFKKAPKGFHFAISALEVEQLLQALNDVRVGAWIILGKPENLDGSSLDSAALPYFIAMEVAGYFQTAFLAAIENSQLSDSEDP